MYILVCFLDMTTHNLLQRVHELAKEPYVKKKNKLKGTMLHQSCFLGMFCPQCPNGSANLRICKGFSAGLEICSFLLPLYQKYLCSVTTLLRGSSHCMFGSVEVQKVFDAKVHSAVYITVNVWVRTALGLLLPLEVRKDFTEGLGLALWLIVGLGLGFKVSFGVGISWRMAQVILRIMPMIKYKLSLWFYNIEWLSNGCNYYPFIIYFHCFECMDGWSGHKRISCWERFLRIDSVKLKSCKMFKPLNA